MEEPESPIPIREMIQATPNQNQLILNSLPETIQNKLTFFKQDNNNGTITNKIVLKVYNPKFVVNEGY